jgi:hypothetical protein
LSIAKEPDFERALPLELKAELTGLIETSDGLALAGATASR